MVVAMDKLQQLRLFVRIAERGSFSAVAREWGMSQPAVSKAIAALEKQLTVRLVNRNTRYVALTQAGQQYFAHCQTILRDLDAAEQELTASQCHLSGNLYITAPVPFGTRFIAPLLAQFQQQHPQLAVQLHLEDQQSQWLTVPFDVAIRLGNVGGVETVARQLGESPFRLVAAPAYLARHGMPIQLTDLNHHSALCYCHANTPQQWLLQDVAGKQHSIALQATFTANNLSALHAAACAGAGIACLPHWMVVDDVHHARLQVLFPTYKLPTFAIYAVYPSARQMPLKVRQFVDFVQTALQNESVLSGKFH